MDVWNIKEDIVDAQQGEIIFTRKEFHWADYLVFVLFLVATALIGVIIGVVNRHKATSKEFLQAGSDMHYFPVAFSMQASFISAIFVVSIPGESYNFGIGYGYLILSYAIAFPLIGKLILPVFFDLKLTSAYEYLEMRFNRAVRIAGSVVFMLEMLLYLAVVIYTPALSIQQVTPLPTYACILIVAGVCIIYTVAGGMRATIWNDMVQMIVIMVLLGTLIGFGHQKTGTVKEVFHIAQNASRMEFNIFDPDPRIRTTFWSHVLGGTFLNFSMYAASQTIIQKALSTRSLKDAQKSLGILIFTMSLMVILVLWLGIVMYAYYKDCDPQMAGMVDKPDQIVPNFMMDMMGDLHGLPGLFMAAIFSGALSSVSGCLNAMAGVCLVDFIGPAYKYKTGQNLPERLGAILSRVLALVLGLVTMGLAFAAPSMGSLILQIAISIFGMVGGPLCGMVAAGIFLPFVNPWGALTGLIVSLGVTLWVGVGTMIDGPPAPILSHSIEGCQYANITNFTTVDPITMTPFTTDIPAEEEIFGFYKLSYMYYGLVSIGTAMVVAALVSAVSGLRKGVPYKQIFSFADECCCYCPQKTRNCCRCYSLLPEEEEDDGTDLQGVKVRFSKGSLEKVAGFEKEIKPVRYTYISQLSFSDSEKPDIDKHTSFPETQMTDKEKQITEKNSLDVIKTDPDGLYLSEMGAKVLNERAVNGDDSGISANNDSDKISSNSVSNQSDSLGHDNTAFDTTL